MARIRGRVEPSEIGFRILVLGALAAVAVGGSSLANAAPPEASPAAGWKVVLKLTRDAAQGVHASLPEARLQLEAGADAPLVRARKVESLRPVHPSLHREMKRTGRTADQLGRAAAAKHAARARRSSVAARSLPDLSRSFVAEVKAGSRAEFEAALAALRSDPGVEFADEEKVYSVHLVPNDPYFGTSGTWGQAYDDLYGLKKIGCPQAWDLSTGAGIVVAVVDTGLDAVHPDIAANVWTNPLEIAGNGIDDDGNGYIDDVNGWDFVSNDNVPQDWHGHGTHVSGTIAAVGNNGIGVVGVAYGSKVMPLKGIADNGFGTESALANALYYAADNGADVINNSWGGQGFSQLIKGAVDYAHAQGAVVVAAAGNSSRDARDYYPAGLSNVITVGASDAYDGVTSFSNYGVKIDVTAPGWDVLSLHADQTLLVGTLVGTQYARASGTSMAAPHVSGVAALILSRTPTLSPEQVRQAMRATAYDSFPAGFDVNSGYGRVNAAAAVALDGPLEVKIESPAQETHLTGAAPVIATARGGAGLGSWTLDYGRGDVPTTWTALQSGTAPLSSAAAGTFDPSTLTDGTAVLRLRGVDGLGRTFEDRIRVNVDYVLVSSPVPPVVPNLAAVYKPGVPLPISGSARGPSFQSFRVEWARGLNPSTGWSVAGMTATSGGSVPVASGTLATWDTSGVSAADWYTIRVTVENQGFSSEARTIVYLEPDLLSPNWPQWLDQGPVSHCGAAPVRNADGTFRLAIVNPLYSNTPFPGRCWIFANDNSSYTQVILNWASYKQPAAADLDGIAGDEVVVGDKDSVRVIRTSDFYSYSLLTGRNVTLTYSSLTLEDLDRDGKPEILCVGTEFATKLAYLFAWKADGTSYSPNFPLVVGDNNMNLNYGTHNRFLVVDVDGDGRKEIVFASGDGPAERYSLRLYNADGTVRTWNAPVLAGALGQMAAADLDGDGRTEIVLSHSNTTTNFESQIWVLDDTGAAKPGWPYTFPSGYSWGFAFIALADLDRDGSVEIAISSFKSLHVLRSDGTAFSAAWPRYNGSWQFGPPAVADLDGDGYPEILSSQYEISYTPNPLLPASVVGAAPELRIERPKDGPARVRAVGPPGVEYYYSNLGNSESKLLALRSDNTVFRSWRMMGSRGNQSFYDATPTVGDFNNDGKVDIALTYFLIGGGDASNGTLSEGILTVYTLPGSSAGVASGWPSRYQDRQNRSRTAVPSTAYRQDPGADGLVAIEAENYDLTVTQGGHTWGLITGAVGYAGTGAMESQPNSGVNVNTGYTTGSPRLDFQVNFVKTGTHHVWVRGWGPSGNDDSCHVGLDGQALASSDRISTFSAAWGWSKTTMDASAPATINVATPGIHTLNLWMREDGFRVDRIVLTTNAAYTPTGTGPAESPRNGQVLPVVTVSATDAAAAEAGPDSGTFTVARTGSTASALAVSFTLSGTATNGTDFAAIGASVTIPAGAASAPVTVAPVNDSAYEGSETVVLTLSGGAGYAVGSSSSATVSIADDDPPPPPTVTLWASDASAGEPGGADLGIFMVARTGSTSAALTVNVTVGGTATNGTDYASLGTTVVIPAGATQNTVTVTPLDDTLVEGNETVVLSLASGGGYVVGSPSGGTVTITDNDTVKTALFVVGSTTLNTGDAAVRTRLQNLGYTVTVKGHSAAATGDATGKTVVVISSTVTSGNVNTKFRTVAVPVINWESALLDDLGMTGLTNGTDYGVSTGQTAVSIVNASHSMAGGLSGTPTVVTAASSFTWGKPNANAARIANLASDATRAVIFGYVAGAAMPGLAAPARRVGFFLENTTAASLNASGWALFDAAVAWATSAPGTSTLALARPGGDAQGGYDATIQEAIDGASPGSTVWLDAMRYYVPAGVVLKAGVTLRGAGPNLTVLDGQGAPAVLRVSGTPLEGRTGIEQLGITGGVTGIDTGSADVVLRNVLVVRNAGDGIVTGQAGIVEGVSLTVADNGGNGVVVQTPQARLRGLISSRNGVMDVDAVPGAGILYSTIGPIGFRDRGSLDYRARADSPSIDGGDPADDFSLEPEPNGGRVNQGAFGNTPLAEGSAAALPPPVVPGSDDGDRSAPGGCGALGAEVLLVIGWLGGWKRRRYRLRGDRMQS